ncbi:uncharacterized protein METZ01_LOCUS165703 [marine metagenome]|uniref:Uncharacterized protein n=1 Tax=marine metagenome TaxID=408172 RepID=A0A382BGW7_9ZZZZ|tara:strand:- start:8 stop:271 length:264 start_codon:yes stop_codon:yes gene_type:complete
MKKIFFILSVFLTSILVAEDNTVVTRMVVGDDPRAGIIHVLCIEDYKFAIYQNSRVVRTAEGYAGESQSSSMTQILDDRGRGIKCSK